MKHYEKKSELWAQEYEGGLCSQEMKDFILKFNNGNYEFSWGTIGEQQSDVMIMDKFNPLGMESRYTFYKGELLCWNGNKFMKKDKSELENYFEVPY